MRTGFLACISLALICLLSILLLPTCSSHGTSPAITRVTQGFELEADVCCLLDGAQASFELKQRELPDGQEITVFAEDAQGLKAFYGDIFYSSQDWHPVEVKHLDGLDTGGELLCIESLADTGVVHLGQVAANWPECEGVTGVVQIATIRFASGPAPAVKAARGVPDNELSRSTLTWTTENTELSWRYYQQGDYNQDGFVTLNDLTPLGVHYGTAGPFDPDSAISCVDGNADGFITVNDITPIGANYGNMITGYQLYFNTEDDFPDTFTGGNGSAARADWIEFGSAEEPEDERLLFSHTFTDPVGSGWFWVRPSNGLAEGTPSTIVTSHTFDISISADITTGTAPFLVGLSAEPVAYSGVEPITYTWEVFDDIDPFDAEPSIGFSPALDPAANISPAPCVAQHPTICFGNPTGATEDAYYAVRCTAVDAIGSEVQSNLLRVVVSPGDPGTFYYSEQPYVDGEIAFDSNLVIESANPQYIPLPIPEFWNPRANPAVCTHPTGLAFIIGGEILDEDGNFISLVERGDSIYTYIPRTDGTGSDETQIGKFSTYEDRGSLIRLNDKTAPGFPSSPTTPMSPQWPSPGGDTKVPVQQDPEQQPAHPPVVPTLRSAPFTIVGSAAAVMIHERPETNPAGAYPDRGTNSNNMPPVVIDRDIHGMPVDRLWSWPDSPLDGWAHDYLAAGHTAGTGVPVIYVLGGRTDATTAVDLVQKYYPWGFGSEDLPPWSETYNFQTTCNQTNIWSPYFLRPDTDQFPGDTANFNPVIPDRGPQGAPGAEQYLPHLPEGRFGMMATRIESGVDTPYPVFPNGPYSYIYLFGGINSSGEVSTEALLWDHSVPATPANEDIMLRLAEMPTPRAYGQAVFLPGDTIRIALAGGIGADGQPVSTIDVFSFDDHYNPNSGSWETFGGTLPEAMQACGAGYYLSSTAEQLLVFGMVPTDPEAQTALQTSPYKLDLAAGGTEATTLEYPVALRRHAGFGQSGSSVLSGLRVANMLGPVDYNRFYLFGGLGTEGMTNTIEVFGYSGIE